MFTTDVALILALLLPLLMAAAFLLGRHLQQRPQFGPHLSAVSRQHIDLFQGGQLNEAAVEAAKSRFRDLLERGEVDIVEASLRPGEQYIFQVRALAEIGTEIAGRILERQLQRRLSEDQLEQSWYWIDLACSLRTLSRQESLPHLLRCAERAGDGPLSHFFAAETICFIGFPGYLRQPNTPLGRAALRLLHRALEGLRFELPPHIVAEASLGTVIENLWDDLPEGHSPLLVRIAWETLRLLRRVPHARHLLVGDKAEEEAFAWQVSRLAALEPVLMEYVEGARAPLLQQLAKTPHSRDLMLALNDLRVDVADVLLPRLDTGKLEPWDLAIDVLAWSQQPQVGLWLRDLAARHVNLLRRAQKKRRPVPPKRPSLPDDVPYRSVLHALRGHPSRETENFLILAAKDWDPTYRAAALGSFGWWEPLQRVRVLECLEEGRRDVSAEVRQSARAALARLGERQALYWFRQALAHDSSDSVHEAMQVIAAENLFLLWPDLDRLADSENLDLAAHARETLECLSEDLNQPRFRD